jgi:hypothetical protein
LVGEVSCRIVQYVLQNESITGLRCESEIQELLSSTDTPFSLTEKLLKKQLYEMTCHSVFGKEIEEGQIRLHALLTSRHDDFIAPINCEFLQRMTMPISNINPLDNTNYRHLLPYAESIF